MKVWLHHESGYLSLNTFQLNIIMHILPTVLYTFPRVMIGRIRLTIMRMNKKLTNAMGRPESESIRSIGIDVFCMLWKLKALLYPHLLPGISSKSGLSWRACKYSFRSEITVSQHQINTELNASINLKLQHPPWHLNFCRLVRSNPVPGTKIVFEIPTRVPDLIVSFFA